MSMRTAKRQIAKARMAALGIDRINSRMGRKAVFSNGTIRKMMRTAHGRQHYAELVKDDTPNWRRILTGDLAAEAEQAMYPKKGKTSSKTRRIRKIK